MLHSKLAPLLPNEIIAQIIDKLPRDALVSASRVCKTWYYLALPILYNSVSLGRNSHIERLLRLLAGDNVLTSSIPTYIHHLCFTHTINHAKVTNSLLLQLEPCISRLSQLRELSWDVRFVPKDLEFIKSFHTQCPRLKKVHLSISYRLDASLEGQYRYAPFLGFKNLDSFELELDCLPSNSYQVLWEPLKGFIRNSPELQEFMLDLKDNPVSPEHFLASMGPDFTLPRLHTFHLSGGLEFDATDIPPPTPPGSGASHFLDFLLRHPLLKDLKLDCTFLYQFCDDINSDVLARALPVLERFDGPYFFWDCLAPIAVATRLTSLTINHWEFDPEELNITMSNKQLKLPALRTLDIAVTSFAKAMDILELCLLAASGLRELFFPAAPSNYHKRFLYLLSHTPEIRMVCLWNYDFLPGGFSQKKLVAAMKDMYPKLVVKCDGEWE